MTIKSGTADIQSSGAIANGTTNLQGSTLNWKDGAFNGITINASLSSTIVVALDTKKPSILLPDPALTMNSTKFDVSG